MNRIVGLMVTVATVACGADLARPATYGAELEECNRTATSCEESIACENLARAKYKRAPRDTSKGCK